MNQDEFERDYAKRTGVTVTQFRDHMIGLPCACEDAECRGWAAVSRDPETIAEHLRYFAPFGSEDALASRLRKLGFKNH